MWPTKLRCSRQLRLQHDEPHALLLQLLGEAGVIRVVMRHEQVANRTACDAGALECVAERWQRARKADIHQQVGASGRNRVGIGRGIAHVHDRHGLFLFRVVHSGPHGPSPAQRVHTCRLIGVVSAQ